MYLNLKVGNGMVIKKSKIETFLLACSIFMSVMTQIFVEISALKLLMYLFWIISLLYPVINKKFIIKLSLFTKSFIVIYFIFIIYCFLCSIIFQTNHVQNFYIQILQVPLMVTIAGDLYKERLFEKNLQFLCKIYFVSALLFGIWVQIKYFPSFSLFFGRSTYAFTQKNSAAQIWATAIIINLLFLKYKKRIYRMFSILCSIYMFLIICMCQCRTAILGLALVTCFHIVFYSRKKILAMLTIIISGIVLIQFDFLQKFMEQALLLNKYSGTSLDAFSSGRLGFWAEAWKTFSNSPIIGIGVYYTDCSYLSVLAESGIVGFCLIESVWIKKIFTNIIKRMGTKEGKILGTLTIFFLVESFLEGFPPFGPGVSSFMFWFLSAIS